MNMNNDAFNVLLLGQCTTTWLVRALDVACVDRQLKAHISEANFDNVMQTLLAMDKRNAPDVVVLLPWSARIQQRYQAGHTGIIHDEMQFWQQAWKTCEALGVRCIQVSYDTFVPGPRGWYNDRQHGGWQRLIDDLNQALRSAKPEQTYCVELDLISGDLGRQQFYDPRGYYWTKQPFSQVGLACLAQHLAAGMRTMISGPKKVLVLDLDNTLWGGVVGEADANGIVLAEGPDGEAFCAFQAFIKGLKSRGVLLAVASKNNPADAQAPFEKNASMVLQLDDFAAFVASWDPKAQMLAEIAQQLNLGLSDFVFFDDNPVERAHICHTLPEVTVIDVPPDPADYIGALQRSLWFEYTLSTEADNNRTQQYLQEGQRVAAKQLAVSLEDYWASLDMKARISSITQDNIQRVTQLIGKTNQFNLTTKRHAQETIISMTKQSDAVCLALSLIDKFGDYGLISVLLANGPATHQPRVYV